MDTKQRTLTKAKLAHRRNREAQRTGHKGREDWRGKPATAVQLEALRALAMRSGLTFEPSTVTRGEAWRRIRWGDFPEPVRNECAPPWARR